MESLRLNKHLCTDFKSRMFMYSVDVQGTKCNMWFPWSIVGVDFPERYPVGSELSVSYYRGKFRDTVDWIGSISK